MQPVRAEVLLLLCEMSTSFPAVDCVRLGEFEKVNLTKGLLALSLLVSDQGAFLSVSISQ